MTRGTRKEHSAKAFYFPCPALPCRRLHDDCYYAIAAVKSGAHATTGGGGGGGAVVLAALALEIPQRRLKPKRSLNESLFPLFR